MQWRGEGLRAQLHGAAAALRPSAHGAGESWKNFILQTQGIAGNVTSATSLSVSFFLLKKKKKKLSQTSLDVSCHSPARLFLRITYEPHRKKESFGAGAKSNPALINPVLSLPQRITDHK